VSQKILKMLSSIGIEIDKINIQCKFQVSTVIVFEFQQNKKITLSHEKWSEYPIL